MADHLDRCRLDNPIEFFIPSTLKCDVGGYKMIRVGEIASAQSRDPADHDVLWDGQVLCFAYIPSEE